MGKIAKVRYVRDGVVHIRYADPSMRPDEEGCYPVHLVRSEDIIRG